MFKVVAVAVSICLALVCADPVKRDSVVDKGDFLLVCSQEPIEFGIVLDSSSSIRPDDFMKARKFLVNFLEQFDIGTGRNDVRVSIITFGKGIYPQDGFDLDTYDNKVDVLHKIANMRHRAGPYTDTGLAIQYMHDVQLTEETVRPYAEKIGLVITDGNSQRWSFTRDQAKLARADNITMFALGIGSARQVSMRELLRIAGDEERVTRVDNFDDLDAVKTILAKKTCIKKKKPTTTPPPKTETCGESTPTDMEFIFSPKDLGVDATAWVTSFVSNIVDRQDLQDIEGGFRYGVKAGSCPDDEGFPLDRYTNIEDIKERLGDFDKLKLPSLIGDDLFSAARGGRQEAGDVAVVFLDGDKGLKGGELEAKIKALVAKNVTVYVANPFGFPVNVPGTTPLSGRGSNHQAEDLINLLCPSPNHL